MRVVAVMLLLSAGIAAEAVSYSFVSKASERLGGPIRFEFYAESTTRPKTDIKSFTVSMRTADDRWKAMWSILSGRGLTQPIEYGVTPPGFYHDDSTAEAHSRSRLRCVRYRRARRLI